VIETMADGVTYTNLPKGLYAVAGYCDGPWRWPAEGWAAFPGSLLVRIATIASTDDGDALDVENGDATPGQAPGWVLRRRLAGVVPKVYCNLSTWPEVKAAFVAQAVADPLYWLADWNDPTLHLATGSVATQFQHALPPGYDLSAIDPELWGGGMNEAQMQAFLDGLARAVSGQVSFVGWMQSVLSTSQQNLNSLAALLAELKATGDPATLAVVSRIEAALKVA